jgi:hypothetical protein
MLKNFLFWVITPAVRRKSTTWPRNMSPPSSGFKKKNQVNYEKSTEQCRLDLSYSASVFEDGSHVFLGKNS